MNALTAPTKDQDCRTLWKVVAQICGVINGLGNCTVNTDAKENKLTLTESNVRLDLKIPTGGGGVGSALDGWWVVAIDGQPMYCQFASGTPVATLPPGATLVNRS